MYINKLFKAEMSGPYPLYIIWYLMLADIFAITDTILSVIYISYTCLKHEYNIKHITFQTDKMETTEYVQPSIFAFFVDNSQWIC